jgi:hypothetical protein
VVESIFERLTEVASNFLCHMEPAEAENCLRNVGGIVLPKGHLSLIRVLILMFKQRWRATCAGDRSRS